MVEISEKYKLGIRRFGSINWIGFLDLVSKRGAKIFDSLDSNTIVPDYFITFILFIGMKV